MIYKVNSSYFWNNIQKIDSTGKVNFLLSTNQGEQKATYNGVPVFIDNKMPDGLNEVDYDTSN